MRTQLSASRTRVSKRDPFFITRIAPFLFSVLLFILTDYGSVVGKIGLKWFRDSSIQGLYVALSSVTNFH